MNLIEALGEERYEHYRNKFKDWGINEIIIDDSRAFWEIKKPGSMYEKVSLYRDNETMLIYGDYGRYSFSNMTWQGSPENLCYNDLGYQMEKLDYNTNNCLRIFDEELCEKEIKEWLANHLSPLWNIEKENLKELIALDPDDWIMAEAHYDEVPDTELFCKNFSCFADGSHDLETIVKAINDSDLDITVELDNDDGELFPIMTIRSYEVSEEMEFARNAIIAAREGENSFLSFLDSEASWEMVQDFRDDNTGYRTDERFYVALVALEVLGEKLKERDLDMDEREER